jgi:hypothetical protein
VLNRRADYKRALTLAVLVVLAACGDVETWRMTAYDGSAAISEEYTTSEERCHKRGQVAKSLYGYGYTCELVAFHENFPGGELGARALAVVIPWAVALFAPEPAAAQ